MFPPESARVRSPILVFVAGLLLLTYVPCLASDQGELSGTVRTRGGEPVRGASLSLSGGRTATSKRDGEFRFEGLLPGTYHLVVTSPGFERLERDGLTVVPGGRLRLDLDLVPLSFEPLHVVGQVTAGVSALNRTSAAVSTLDENQLVESGVLNVARALDTLPGVVATYSSDGGLNAASGGAQTIPQIRGALPYETESLVDGHPISIGADGSFSSLLMMPGLLQSIEVIKGPGATGTEINSAIGGSVNYRTLEPSATQQWSADVAMDRFGGVDTTARATGRIGGSRLTYAAAFTTLGEPGPLHLGVASSQLPLIFGSPPWLINGQPYAGSPIVLGPSSTPQYAGVVGLANYANPLYLCCTPLDTGYTARGELAKLRYDFSPTTTLSVGYLGGQAFDDLSGTRAASMLSGVNFSIFAPPAGYTGTVPAGTPIPFISFANANLTEWQQANMLEGELRTTIGTTTVLARYYASSNHRSVGTFPLGSDLNLTENAWGGVPLCPTGSTFTGASCALSGGGTAPPTLTFFNGQPVTLSATSAGAFGFTYDNIEGFSLELAREIGTSQVAVSLDRSVHQANEYQVAPTQNLNGYTLPPGSSQGFTTGLVRVELHPFSTLSATLSDYLISYSSHFTGDGGVTWNDSTHSFDAPRVGISWRPSQTIAWRLSLGGSIAPPYLTLISSPGSTPLSNAPGGATYYTQNANNGQVAPETAFGYDAGADAQLANWLIVSGDVYLTNLRNMFLPETYLAGTYTPSTGADAGNTEPLYVSQTANLGHARFEGIEATLRRAPPRGLTFTASMSLERAYPYGLPPGFYDTASGPNTTNLGILPYVNFQTGGVGYNALSGGRIPYAQGYADVGCRARNGGFSQIGITYFGANNPYNHPAFAIVSAAVRVPLGPRTWVQLNGDNILNAYPKPYADYFGGVPVALANGQLGATSGVNLGPPALLLSVHTQLR